MAETTEAQTSPAETPRAANQATQIERRSPERLKAEQDLRVYESWLKSLDERVQSGTLTDEQRLRLTAVTF